MIKFSEFITEAKEPDAHEGHLKHIRMSNYIDKYLR